MSPRVSFKDHFSTQAADYQRYRPSYPPAFFRWLADTAPVRRLAIDVATGNGQAALGLAEHFDEVIATDASAAQLAEVRAHPRIRYRHEPAESIGVPDRAADLVVAAQAAHWFDWPAFSSEARRVLGPGGVIAVWCYELFRVDPAIDRLVGDFSRDAVGPWWPRERRHVEEGYRNLALPVAEIATPTFDMQAEWDLAAVLGYLGTWSAVRRCRARTGRDALAILSGPLAALWGSGVRSVRWPLVLKVGRA